MSLYKRPLEPAGARERPPVEEILAKRLGEVEARAAERKEQVRLLFEAYPDIRAFLLDLKQAGFPAKMERFTWNMVGPQKETRIWWPALPADTADRQMESTGATITRSTIKSSRGTGATGMRRSRRS